MYHSLHICFQSNQINSFLICISNNCKYISLNIDMFYHFTSFYFYLVTLRWVFGIVESNMFNHKSGQTHQSHFGDSSLLISPPLEKSSHCHRLLQANLRWVSVFQKKLSFFFFWLVLIPLGVSAACRSFLQMCFRKCEIHASRCVW